METTRLLSTLAATFMALHNGAHTNQTPVSMPQLTVEEEDRIILARITNDERPLRRVMKKFYCYASLAHPPVVPPLPGTTTANSVDDAREAFVVELASYQLSLKKSAMICDAETRQVEEYLREKERIEQEHITLRGQIEELKVALEQAQMLRRRKIEYDLVTEKINTLPPRDELELSINALESDVADIRADHESQTLAIRTQKLALDGIIADLTSLRFLGKDKETATTPNSARATPLPEGTDPSSADAMSEQALRGTYSDQDLDHSSPGKTEDSVDKEEDFEMGEVEENGRNKLLKKKMREEELEEGEASDFSSELSDPPDD